jgi:hypothetical protein
MKRFYPAPQGANIVSPKTKFAEVFQPDLGCPVLWRRNISL